MIHKKTSNKKAEANKKNLQKAIKSRVEKGNKLMVCATCGKEKKVHVAAIKKGWKTCSWECRVKRLVGKNAPNYGGGEKLRGELNPNYKDGLANVRAKTRDVGAMAKWRRRVFEKDGYKCVRCGFDKGKILNAHHIKPYAKYPNHRTDVDNGVTLCNPCHKWVHSKNNTEKIFIGG